MFGLLAYLILFALVIVAPGVVIGWRSRRPSWYGPGTVISGTALGIATVLTAAILVSRDSYGGGDRRVWENQPETTPRVMAVTVLVAALTTAIVALVAAARRPIATNGRLLRQGLLGITPALGIALYAVIVTFGSH